MEKLKIMFGLNGANFIGGAIGLLFVLFGNLLFSIVGIITVLYNLYVIKENYEFEYPND